MLQIYQYYHAPEIHCVEVIIADLIPTQLERELHRINQIDVALLYHTFKN